MPTNSEFDIAIVGMSCRLPGAQNLDEFWRNLAGGIESITRFSDQEILESGVPACYLSNPNYVKAAPILEEPGHFDAGFFGFSPMEAKSMDPQHRILLELAHEALENAAYNPDRYQRRIGVFAGAALNTYFMNVGLNSRLAEEYIPTLIGNDKDFLSTRISYKLNLKGPSITVQTACSTSMVAVHLARQSLLSGETDMTLAGAISVRVPHRAGYFCDGGGIVSADAHVRAFDARANGTVFGSGGGILVLKRLADAISDGDTIHAVIKGSAVNNDGSEKAGYAAPSVNGQAEAVVEALANAGVEADSISYIEAHGSGTPVGDPIEIRALNKAFRTFTQRSGYCAIGSVKTNVGHLDAAAGVAGMIKTVLALKHRKIPASLNFNEANPEIDFPSTPFYVNTRLREWSSEGPRRAGVMATGMGGTNAYLVLEEAPEPSATTSGKPPYLLVLSAKTETALDQATLNLQEFFRSGEAVDMADVSYTLQVGRKAYSHRRFVVCGNRDDAVSALDVKNSKRAVSSQADEPARRPLVFLLPGIGDQYVGMGFDLYERGGVFKQEVDRCAEILQPYLDIDIRDVIYPKTRNWKKSGQAKGIDLKRMLGLEFGGGEDADAQRLDQTLYAQPALFTVEYALARLWMDLGAVPDAIVGHSMGEYVAACLAGVLSLEDALRLIATRARLVNGLPQGAMLAVPLSEREILPLLSQDLSISLINGPNLCVVAGPIAAMAEFEHVLKAKDINYRPVKNAHAFHSKMLDPIVKVLEAEVRHVQLKEPKIPYISNVTGDWITKAEATDPACWARHANHTARFSDALHVLWQLKNPVLLEIGPGKALGALAMQHPERSNAGNPVVVSSLRPHYENNSDLEVLVQSVGRLWLSRAKIEWSHLHQKHRRRLVPLPSYPFDRKRYWIETPKSETQTDGAGSPANGLPPVSNGNAAQAPLDAPPFHKQPEISMTPLTLKNDSSRGERHERIASRLRTLIKELSGVEITSDSASFTEMGFESLFLTQASQLFQSKFGVKVSFRQMLDDLSTVATLARYIDEQLPLDQGSPAPAGPPVPANVPAASQSVIQASGGSALEQLLAQQVQLMQLLLKQQRGEEPAATQSAVAPPADALRMVSQPTLSPGGTGPEIATQGSNRFGPYKPLEKGEKGRLSARQQAALDQLIARYVRKTAASKRYTAEHRQHFADPRAVAGFKSNWKEMVYPLVSERSKGSKIWDIDGNEYIDITMGFGIYLFGHSPDWLIEALQDQLRSDIAIGPQSSLAGKVAELICDFTGMERVTFCNTGSEAVMAAIRLARMITGRKRVVFFAGDYHGMFEEVLVRGAWENGQYRAQPAAPGIPANLAENMLVLDYGTPESLEIIRTHASEIAAVLVEPVRSRQPGFQPRAFLHSLREITEQTGAALIFDEMVTGFRCHPGGAQAYFGVQADLATYGKVLGGGIPIGVLAGKRKYMDGLDGGAWTYGDDSFPEVGVTFFAGTFVRHPLAMAAAWQVLNHLKEQGPRLQLELTERVARFCRTLNEHFEKIEVPIRMPHFSAYAMIEHAPDLQFISLLWYYLREKGIHAWEGRTCYFTLAHTDEDFDRMIVAFKESVAEMQAGGFLPESAATMLPAGAIPNAGPEYPRFDTSPVTEAQREVLLAAIMDDAASCVFNQSCTVHFKGPLDVPALEESIRQVFDRHPALRSSFSADLERQIFHPNRVDKLSEVEVSGLTEAEQAKRFNEFVYREMTTPFDLERGPMVRLTLFKISAESHRLVLTAHHLVCDGWSITLVIFDLSRIYNAIVAGRIPLLPPPTFFADFARDRDREKGGAENKATEQFWLDQYAAGYTTLNLPTDRPRPTVRTYSGNMESRIVNPELFARLKKSTSHLGGTLFATLFGAYVALLHRLTSQDDIVIGVPAAGQAIFGCSDLVGHCVNFLPIRARFSGETPFAEFARAIKDTVLNAYDHQKFTYGTLVQKLRMLPRDGGRSPLLSVVFNIDKSGFDVFRFDQLDFHVSHNAKRHVNFDLFFNLIQTETSLEVECEYNSDLFDNGTIVRWLAHFETLIDAIVTDANIRVGSLPLMSKQEEQQILVEWNRTEASYPQNQTLHALLAEQAVRTPDRVALEFEGRELTYAQLNARANQLARVLRKRGVGPDVLVGVFAERSFEMVVALLAVLKAGGAYVPLDPSYPAERLRNMLEDAQVPLILAQPHLASQLPAGAAQVVELDASWAAYAGEAGGNLGDVGTPEDLAYVIFTSGSTGRPKGAMNEHRGIVNRLLWMQEEYGLTGEDRVLQKTPFSFDVSVWEFFWPLMTGARLVISRPEGHRDSAYLVRLIRESRITTLHFVPSMLRVFLEGGGVEACRSLKRVICSGEALPHELQERFFARLPGTELHNLYGPTEAAVDVTYWACRPGDERLTVPIGRPVANTQIYVLDGQMRPVPVGVSGELYIGGVQVGRGYVGRPDLTAERFVPDPFSRTPGARLYRTGDLVRHLSDGAIEYLGRLDHQVKVRGFRVELGEIEAVLAEHPDVRQAAVHLWTVKANDVRIVACCVPAKAGVLAPISLRKHLRARLPEYMIPQYFLPLEEIPLTPSGKVDRLRLPIPVAPESPIGRQEAPADAVEAAIGEIWTQLIQPARAIGRNDKFFEMGGHSLLALQALRQMEQKLGVKLDFPVLFLESLADIATRCRTELSGSPGRMEMAAR